MSRCISAFFGVLLNRLCRILTSSFSRMEAYYGDVPGSVNAPMFSFRVVQRFMTGWMDSCSMVVK